MSTYIRYCGYNLLQAGTIIQDWLLLLKERHLLEILPSSSQFSSKHCLCQKPYQSKCIESRKHMYVKMGTVHKNGFYSTVTISFSHACKVPTNQEWLEQYCNYQTLRRTKKSMLVLFAWQGISNDVNVLIQYNSREAKLCLWGESVW